MKNIHILPTDKPSRVFITKDEGLGFDNQMLENTELDCQNQNIYITSEEEIKEGCYLDLTHNIIMKSVFYSSSDKNCQKIILTTDQDLIKDGVQTINDEFLEWFVKNPSCEEVEIETFEVEDYVGFAGHTGYPTFHNEYKIIIPKEKPKQETLEEAVDKASLLEFPIKEWYRSDDYSREEITAARDGFKRGAKWQQERSYSEEEVLNIIQLFNDDFNMIQDTIPKWFEQFKKK